MSRFYFILWLQWALKVTLYTLVVTFVIATSITFGIYIIQGMKPLENEVIAALMTVFKFWFLLSWNFALLLILFRSIKYIFNNCIKGYTFALLTCPTKEQNKEVRGVVGNIGYGDLVKVWRKWFMLLVWIVAVEMILALIVMKLFSPYENIFDWFNSYLLYAFILVAGYFSFIVLSVKCKKVRIHKC